MPKISGRLKTCPTFFNRLLTRRVSEGERFTEFGILDLPHPSDDAFMVACLIHTAREMPSTSSFVGRRASGNFHDDDQNYVF